MEPDEKIKQAEERLEAAKQKLRAATERRERTASDGGVAAQVAQAQVEVAAAEKAVATAELRVAKAEKAVATAKTASARKRAERQLETAKAALSAAEADKASAVADLEAAEKAEDQRIADLQVGLPYSVTEQVGAALAPGAAPPAPGAPIVTQRLRNILSFQPSPERLPETLEALERAFDTVTEDGITKVVYAPGGPSTPAATVEVTGVQGSIYARARSALDQILPILDGLTSLRPELTDDEEAEAARAIISSSLRQLVEALGADEGPSVLLIDGLWSQLLGVTVGQPAPAAGQVGGEFGDLRGRLFLKRKFIDSLEDERIYTRYLTLVEAVLAIYSSWAAHRSRFTGRGGADFGQALGQLRRILQKVGDDVEDVEQVLDDRMMGRTERRLMRIEYEGATLYLQTTLDWIKSFVTEDAVHLLDVAGKDGALSLYPTLYAMASAAERFVPPVGGFPTLYGSPLVKAAMATLAQGLDEAVRAVKRIGRPSAIFEFPTRRGPSPAEAMPPENVLQPTELAVVAPSVKEPKVVLGLGLDLGGELTDVAAIARASADGLEEALRRLKRRVEEELERVAIVLRDRRGNDFPGVLVDVQAEVVQREVIVVAFFEFELSAASIESAREEFELVVINKETHDEIVTGFVVPISP